MYELGMSSDGRREPVFGEPVANAADISLSMDNGASYSAEPRDPFVLDDDHDMDAGAILMRSGIVIALALAAFGGYKFHQGNHVSTQTAGEIRTDWAGRPLATNDQGNLVWPDGQDKAPRNIDLTKTASIDSKPKPKVIEAKPIPIGKKVSANAKFHIVESGDTLSAIARNYKVSTADIMEINSIENPRRIKPGMKLYVTR